MTDPIAQAIAVLRGFADEGEYQRIADALENVSRTDTERLDWLIRNRIYEGSHHDCGVQLTVDEYRWSKKKIRKQIDKGMSESA